MSHTDHYKVLQVDPEAEAEVVQAAYRRLARKYHPDVAESPEAAARMAAINAAWAVLKDPARRAAYDTQRAGAGHAGATRPHAAPPSVPHRHTAASESPAQPPHRARPPEETSPNWTSGRSSAGSGYDPASMGTPAGHGAAGPPPGNPGGSLLNFGRHGGWPGGETPRRDLEYVEWLDRMPIGRQYREEIDRLPPPAGRRPPAPPPPRLPARPAPAGTAPRPSWPRP